MKICFVAQPFNSETYDQRFEQTYKKAIEAAQLIPYRVDKDPSTVIIIEKIEQKIAECSVFFVDISENNPNVWFEFGMARALQKEMVIVCDKSKRDKLPFDVQHRNTIIYKTENEDDFIDLRNSITASIKLATTRESQNRKLYRTNFEALGIKDLQSFEVNFLLSIANCAHGPDLSVGHFEIANDMEKRGFTRASTNMAAMSLSQVNYISKGTVEDYNGEHYLGYSISPDGWDWILRHPNLSQFIFIEKTDILDPNIPF